MNARTVAQIVAVAGVLGTLVVGCAVQTEGTESTGASSDALIYNPPPPPKITVTCGTSSPLSSSVTMSKVPTAAELEDNFEAALKEVGCGEKQAYATGSGGAGTAWFQSVCPQNVISVDKFYCPSDSTAGDPVYVQMSLGVLYLCYYTESLYGMTFGATTAYCGANVPSGDVTADWDPNCSGPSCAKVSM